MSERLSLVVDHDPAQMRRLEGREVFREVSEILGRRFDSVGVDLWWTTVHPSLLKTPMQLLEEDPSAVSEYGKKFEVRGI